MNESSGQYNQTAVFLYNEPKRKEIIMSRNLVTKKPSTSRVIAPDPDQPGGKRLYIDNKRRIIYDSPLLHQYLYVPKYDYKKFNRYKPRFLVAAAVFMILVSALDAWTSLPVWVSLLISLAAGLLILGWMEYSFYKFQKTLTSMKNFDPAKATPTLQQTITPEMRSRCILRIVLYITLGVLLVYNAYDQHYSSLIIIACWAALAFCFYTAFKLIRLLMRSPKTQS